MQEDEPAAGTDLAVGVAMLSTALAEAIETAKGYARQAHAAETHRAYQHDWRAFEAWCAASGCIALPAEPVAVAAYLASLATTHSHSALQRRRAAIGYQHRLHGLQWIAAHPAIHATLRGIGRTHGVARRRRQAAALTSLEVRQLLATCRDDLAGARDRALLLIGFAAALRRSELVGIDAEHVRPTADGLRLLIPSSKSDAAGDGVELGVSCGRWAETCPARALIDWIERSGTGTGAVFRKIDRWGTLRPERLGADGVRRILLRRARQAGLTVHVSERLSPHGLRTGFVTEAYMAGARDEDIMAHSRHRDLKTMRGYVRRAKLVTDSPVRLLNI